MSKKIGSEFRKRIVYITLGLTGSGKSTRISSLLDKFKSTGNIKSLVISRDLYTTKDTPFVYDSIDEYAEKCIQTLENSLKDLSIRRIFLDDCNLLPELRDRYIQICMSHQVEWVNLCVGKFNKESMEFCATYNKRNLSKGDMKKQSFLWSLTYRKYLNNAELLRQDPNISRVRLMRDLEAVTQGSGENKNVITLGAKPDGSFRRKFTFKSLVEADRTYLEADSVLFKSTPEKSILEVSSDFKGSYLMP